MTSRRGGPTSTLAADGALHASATDAVPLELRTTRLLLRPFTVDDGPELHAYLSQEQAVHYEPYGVHSAQEAAQAAAERAQDDAYWAVCLTQSDDLVGNLYLAPRGPSEWRTWELGYVFNPGHCPLTRFQAPRRRPGDRVDEPSGP